jgi:Ca2+-binding RTX toxin-like protein
MTVYNGVYTSIDVPGAIDIFGNTSTQASSINATGQIVGSYLVDSVRHGFLDDGGTLTFPIDYPGNTVATTAVASINDSGWIIGNFEDPGSPYGFAEQGFLDISGAFSTIDVPQSSETELAAINASGEIIGRYQGVDGAEHGFLDIPTIDPSTNKVVSNNFITIDGPVVNPALGHATFTFASAINASGQIVGHYYDYDTTNPSNPVQGPLHGFFRAIDGTITPIDVPPAVLGDTVSTNPTSINASGEIVGFYQEGSGGQYHGFLDTAFTTSGGTITTIDVPGAIYTQALSINASGEIVGFYEDSVTFRLHGFLDITTIQNGVVSNNFQTIDVPGSTLTEALSINDKGQIVGLYQDSSGTHGFATNIDQALTTTSEAFNYTAGTGVAAAVNLGNPISNDTDPNTGGGVISFVGFNSASFETPPTGSRSDLVNFVAGLTATVAGDVITITSNGLAATVTFDPTTGKESLSDPNNIFASLHSGESIVLDVGYTIKDNLGVLAPNDSQTITIGGATQGHLPPVMLNALFNSADDLTTLSGTAEANSSVSVFEGTKVVGTTTVAADGTWSLNANVTGNLVHSYTETSSLAGDIISSTGVTLYTLAANKALVGGTGDDVLIGRPNDTLTGGAGADTFVFNPGLGKETIKDFNAQQHDVIAFNHTLFTNTTGAQVISQAHDSNGNAVIVVDATDTVTLIGVKVAQLHASDFAFF